jgi:Na+/melibiose symporter-like transporter
MTEPRMPPRKFKVDTRRPRSRSKLRSKIRHVLATAAGMFPLMAAFVYLMSLWRLPVERMPYYRLAIIFFACGMVALLFYAWARSEKLRRHEVSARNRELKYREREEEFQRNQEPSPSDPPAPAAGEG